MAVVTFTLFHVVVVAESWTIGRSLLQNDYPHTRICVIQHRLRSRRSSRPPPAFRATSVFGPYVYFYPTIQLPTRRMRIPIGHLHYSSLDECLERTDVDRLLDEQLFVADDDHIPSNVGTNITSRGWRKIQFMNNGDHLLHPFHSNTTNTATIPNPASPVEERFIGGRRMYIKRDDMLTLVNSGISGNKARKMWILDHIIPSSTDFPSCIVSHGGPQSNSMLALAAIVYAKNKRDKQGIIEDSSNDVSVQNITVHRNGYNPKKRFVYYTKTLPRFLRNQSSGNLFRAMSMGMELVELTPEEYRNVLFEEGHSVEAPMSVVPPVPGDSLWVPQGGACAWAYAGTQHLATEIVSFWKENGKNRSLTVCVPGGTCTTALMLHHSLKKELLPSEDLNDESNVREPMDIEVVVIPCVGDDRYAQRQMTALNAHLGAANVEDVPTILRPCPDQITATETFENLLSMNYFVFGIPNKEILNTFQVLRDEHSLVMDLMYGAPSFAMMMRHLCAETDEEDSGSVGLLDLAFDANNPFLGREIMYVHSGGLEGISSQLLRYKYKGLVDVEDI